MNFAPKRHTSVWLTQAIVAIAILSGIVILPPRLWSVGACVTGNSSQTCSLVAFLPLMRDVLFWGLSIVTFQGLKTRKTYGRILGIGLLLMLMAVSIADSPYVQLLYGAIANGQPLPTPPYECWKQSDIQIEQESCGYATYGELWLRAALSFLFPSIILALLALRLAFSDGTNHFFKTKPLSVQQIPLITKPFYSRRM